MTTQQFLDQLDARIAKYDLLCHPFYKAWSAGELSRDDLREYAKDYYHHVEAFPTYLAEFAIRMDDCELRRAVLANMAEEKGISDASGQEFRAHSELWLDFVEGMGGDRGMKNHIPASEVAELTQFFHRAATDEAPDQVLAAFYAYESQVPRVAGEKARGLREMYGVDEKTCAYFTVHETADAFHAEVWRRQLSKTIEENPARAGQALIAAETAAKALWRALDGIEAKRRASKTAD
ncbi:MAG: iron-containing redox enzyme family protein [Terriglobales bacterium]